MPLEVRVITDSGRRISQFLPVETVAPLIPAALIPASLLVNILVT